VSCRRTQEGAPSGVQPAGRKGLIVTCTGAGVILRGSGVCTTRKKQNSNETDRSVLDSGIGMGEKDVLKKERAWRAEMSDKTLHLGEFRDNDLRLEEGGGGVQICWSKRNLPFTPSKSSLHRWGDLPFVDQSRDQAPPISQKVFQKKRLNEA